MVSVQEVGRRSREFARRFLQTAVVVDDAAYMTSDQSGVPEGEVVVPGRRGPLPSQEDRGSVGRGTEHTLNARSVMDSFAAIGVICGVVGPSGSVMEMMRQADIVVLDWWLRQDDGQYALTLLHDLLTGDRDRYSLRLVAIYTGDSRLEDISEAVFTELETAGLDPQRDGSEKAISYRHGRVVLYAKSEVILAGKLKARSVAEEDLPERLVEDFAAMTEGLLPSIALTSLTAVREGAHMVLDQFSADLDPAFLAHRACLSNPEDAEQQIVSHVAEELRGLMDNAVAAESPAGVEAVEGWIRRRNEGAESFVFDGETLNIEQTITLANEGLKASVLNKNAFKGLSAGFAGGAVVDLDEKLAWIMSFRTVFNAPPPTLWLGSVLTEMVDSGAKHLICLRPRCDCVRLDGETPFLFLPLVAPRKGKDQLVVRLDSGFMRLGIGLDPNGWVHRRFKPPEGTRSLTATKEEPGGVFMFTDTCNTRYTWQGELKAEYTQRIVQIFTMTLSRVAVDESEWLRRMAGKS